MLIVLSLLLFVVAIRIAKQKNYNSGKYFIMLLGASALIAGGNGVKLISDLQAGNAFIALDNTIDTMYQIPPDSIRDLRNDTAGDITLLSITPDPGSACSFTSATPMGLCAFPIPLIAPIVMPAGSRCTVSCSSVSAN